MNLMERNLALIGAVTAVVIAAATVFAIVATRGMLDRGTELSVLFEDAAGLQVDDQVLIAGVRSGRVLSVELRDDGIVEVGVIVETDIPSDSRARIQVQNLLGRRQLMFIAGSAWDDVLADGGGIPVAQTSTPVDVPEFGEETDTLAREVDEVALEAMVTALADITEGQRDEVETLLDGLSGVANVVADREDELETTIDRTEDLFAAFGDRDDEIVRIIDSFGSTLDMLVDRRSDVERLLRETADSSEVIADLVADERPRIDRVLATLHDSLRVVDRNQVDIAHFFAYAGVALEGFANIGYDASGEDNEFWANMRVQEFGPIGADAIFGCGGHVDRQLDTIFGEREYPEACDEEDQQPTPGERSPEEGHGERQTHEDRDPQPMDRGGSAGHASLSGFFLPSGQGVGR